MTPVVTIGGRHLDAHADIRWGLQTGSAPYTSELLLDRQVAERLAADSAADVGADLSLSGPKTLTARVFVLRLSDGTAPWNRRVQLADRRWLWPSVTVCRAFNLRRKTGQGKLVGGRIEVATLVPDIEFVRETLQGKTRPHTVGSALRLLLEDLEQPTAFIHPTLDSMALPDVVLVDPGDRAVKRLMSYAPGWDVALDLQGRLYTVNEADGSEASLVQVLAPQVGRGYFSHVKRNRVRPRRIRVLFDKRCEIRFRYYDQEPTDIRGRERCALDNVLRNPEPELTLASGEVVGPGAWITFEEALSAWQTQHPYTDTLSEVPMDQGLIRRHFASNMMLPLTKFGRFRSGFPDPIWSARIAAVQRHWRQSFRLRRPWRDRISELYPERATIASRVTGQRVQAEVFCNYTVRPSDAGIHDGPSASRADYGWIVRTGHAEDLSTVETAAPATVSIEDQDAGVLRVSFNAGPWGDADAVLPGTAAEGALPSCATGAMNKAQASLAKTAHEWTALEADWQLSIVLTCGQLAPNDQGRMHVETYRASDVRTLGVNVGDALGPIQDLWAPANLVPAYFAWLDSKSEAIRGAFFDGKPHPRELLANRDHVREFGRALAAAFWATLSDGWESSGFKIDMRPATKPGGRVSRVDHIIRPNGELLTELALDPPAPVDRTFQLTPDAVRRDVFRLGVTR